MEATSDTSPAGCVSQLGQRNAVLCEALLLACYITDLCAPMSCLPSADTVRSVRKKLDEVIGHSTLTV